MKSQIFAIDFDGTCTTHNFPHRGKEIGAPRILRRLTDAGHRLILYTMRCNHTTPPISDDPDIHAVGGNYLDDAISWFNENGIDLWAVQTNPTQANWTSSPKCYANWVIDDNAIGTPLLIDDRDKPFVNWDEMEQLLENRGFFNKIDEK